MHLPFRSLAALLLLLGSASPALAAKEQSSSVKPIPAAKVKAAEGRSTASPYKGLSLLEIPDAEGGDFPTAAVYLRSGNQVFPLGSYRGTSKLKWSQDGIRFEGSQLKEYGTDNVYEVTFDLGTMTLRRRFLRTQADQPSG